MDTPDSIKNSKKKGEIWERDKSPKIKPRSNWKPPSPLKNLKPFTIASDKKNGLGGDYIKKSSEKDIKKSRFSKSPIAFKEDELSQVNEQSIANNITNLNEDELEIQNDI